MSEVDWQPLPGIHAAALELARALGHDPDHVTEIHIRSDPDYRIDVIDIDYDWINDDTETETRTTTTHRNWLGKWLGTR